jgi:hypothetical protein
MNHRQMAGRLKNASCGDSADQLAQSNHSGAQSPARRNIHCFSDATAAKQCLHATTDGAPASRREDGISIEIIPHTRTKVGAGEIVNVNSIFRISNAAA